MNRGRSSSHPSFPLRSPPWPTKRTGGRISNTKASLALNCAVPWGDFFENRLEQVLSCHWNVGLLIGGTCELFPGYTPSLPAAMICTPAKVIINHVRRLESFPAKPSDWMPPAAVRDHVGG